MIQFAMSLNQSAFQRATSCLFLVGIVGIIGMCVIDFVIWSYPPGEERIAFLRHITNEPSIWMPFIQIGPWMFGLGIVFASLFYWRKSRLGVLTVIAGSLISATTTSWFTVLAYGLITVGFVLCFQRQNRFDRLAA